MAPSALIDITGQRFGALVALVKVQGFARNAWRCKCDCGQYVIVASYELRRGYKKACCINGHRWKISKRGGLSKAHPIEYRAWYDAHLRCEHKKHHKYKAYGGRGIRVCEQWKKFSAFFEDMGSKPSPAHSLERIDNNGHYEPGNCKWVTRAEQRRNMRSSVYVEFEGQRVLLLDVLAKHKLTRNVVVGRLKMGWSLVDALAIPVRPRAKNRPRTLQ